MPVPELEKLAEEEQNDFLRLYHTPPHELSEEDARRLKHFAAKIDFNRYAFEVEREKAKKLNHVYCEIKSRDPYVVRILFGELELPDELVPKELRNPPSEGYHKDILFAKVAVDLDTGKITQFVFESYLEKSAEQDENG